MMHLRIVAPRRSATPARERLERSESVCNVICLPGVARRPEGDATPGDVARRTSAWWWPTCASSTSTTRARSRWMRSTRGCRTARAHGGGGEGLDRGRGGVEEGEARTSEVATLSCAFVIVMVLTAILISGTLTLAMQRAVCAPPPAPPDRSRAQRRRPSPRAHPPHAAAAGRPRPSDGPTLRAVARDTSGPGHPPRGPRVPSTP